METARKEKSFTLQNVSSTRSYILAIQGNNFQSTSPDIFSTLKTGQTTANVQNIFTKVS